MVANISKQRVVLALLLVYYYCLIVTISLNFDFSKFLTCSKSIEPFTNLTFIYIIT